MGTPNKESVVEAEDTGGVFDGNCTSMAIMLAFHIHAYANAGLNLGVAVMVAASLFLPYFSTADYTVNLFSFSHRLQFEDVQGEVTVSFLKFKAFACGASNISEVLQMCEELPRFQTAGILYFLLAGVLLLGLLLAAFELIIMVLSNGKFKTTLRLSHYCNSVVAIGAVSAYLALCQGKGEALFGVFWMCLVVVSCLATLGHYFYVLKVMREGADVLFATSGTNIHPTDMKGDTDIDNREDELQKALAKIAEQAAALRGMADLSRELTVLQTDNDFLSRQLQSTQEDAKSGLGGTELQLANKLSEALKDRREQNRQIATLTFEIGKLRDGSEPAIRELLEEKDRLIDELQGKSGGEIVKQQASPRVAAGAEVSQPHEFEYDDPLIQRPGPDLSKENADLKSLNEAQSSELQKIKEANNVLVSENLRLSIELSTQETSLQATKSKSSSLEEQLEKALAQLGRQQDVEEVRSLLEDSRHKELSDMKSIYEQRYQALLSDQHTLRSQLDSSQVESQRKDAVSSETRRQKEAAEAQIRSLEDELQSTKLHLTEVDQRVRDAENVRLRLEFDLKKRAGELEIIREQVKSMEETHEKALAELASSRGGQIEAIKKLYAEAEQKDFNDRVTVYTARIERLQNELETERKSKESSDAQSAGFERELKFANKRNQELKTQADNQSSQVEEMLTKLAHIETLLKQTTDENSGLKRLNSELKEQFQGLQDLQTSLQTRNSKDLRDQENRHEKEVERMKELYEMTQGKEVDELKKFYEQKIGKIHGDLVNERQERLQAIDQADKLMKEKETIQAEMSRMQTQLEKEKQTGIQAEKRFSEELESLQSSKLTLEQAVSRLKSDLSKSATDSIHPDAYQDLQDRLTQATASLRDKESSIKELQRTIQDLENRSNVPDTMKQELHQLREQAETLGESLGSAKREVEGKEQELLRVRTQKEEAETRVKDLETQLILVSAGKTEKEKEAKTIAQKLERKKTRLLTARNQLQQALSEKEKQLQDLTESYKLEKEKLKQTYIDIFQQDLEDIRKRYETKIATLQAELTSYRNDSVLQAGKLAEMTNDRSKMTKANRDLGDEIAELKSIIEDLTRKSTDLKGKLENQERENEDLNGRLESMKKSRGEQQGKVLETLETQIAELTRANKTQSSLLDTSDKELDDTRNELRQKETELQGVKEECMALHKELFELQEKAHPRSKSSTSFSRDEKRSGVTPDSSQSVKEIMIIEGMSGPERESNPILAKVATLKKEAPMTYTNVWKFFDNLMMEKCKLDRLEMSLGRQPRTMTEFMLDFVYLHYGLKTLALRQLQALVTSLQELYKAGHSYGVLFCRFIGVFHPRPLPHHLAVYLLVVQEEFNSLSDRIKQRKSEKFADQYDLLQYGGQASVIDLMELIVRICKGNREAGERVIAQLLPESSSRTDIILLKVCGTMARMGKDPKFMFEILDLDQGGAVDYHELVDGIRLKLNIWVSQEEAEELCAYIDEAGTGEISLDDWTAKVSFSEYSDRTASLGMVTKANFLSSLIDEYEFEVVQDYYSLRHMIKRPYMDQDSISDFLLQVDPGLEEKDLNKYYEETLQYETDPRGGISPEAACIIVLKHRIGGFGVGIFGIVHIDLESLDQTLPKSSTEGVNLDLVVARDPKGQAVVDLKRRTVS